MVIRAKKAEFSNINSIRVRPTIFELWPSEQTKSCKFTITFDILFPLRIGWNLVGKMIVACTTEISNINLIGWTILKLYYFL